MKNSESFEPSLYKPDGRKIILYGAGIYGEYAMRALERLNIKADLFCDRAKYSTEFCGIPVISPDQLPEHEGAHVIICACSHFREIELILQKLDNIKYYDMIPLFGIISPQDLKEFHAMTYYENDFFKDQYIMEIDGNNKDNEILITTVNLHITERCTLNCGSCAEMMPYYSQPKDLDITMLISALEKYLQCVDELPIVAIQGGETFMHKELHRLVDFCCKEPKIRQVSLTTNGTIVPTGDNFECLKNHKITVRVNDYINSSRNIDALSEKLKSGNIRFSVASYEDSVWFDIGGLDKRDYTNEQVREVFKTCMFKNDIGIMNGRLYRCARSRAGINLKAIPDCKWEYVNLVDDSSIEETKKSIKKMLKRSYLNSCYYCNSPIYDNVEIKSGLQVKGIIPYKITDEVIENEI